MAVRTAMQSRARASAEGARASRVARRPATICRTAAASKGDAASAEEGAAEAPLAAGEGQRGEPPAELTAKMRLFTLLAGYVPAAAASAVLLTTPNAALADPSGAAEPFVRAGAAQRSPPASPKAISQAGRPAALPRAPAPKNQQLDVAVATLGPEAVDAEIAIPGGVTATVLAAAATRPRRSSSGSDGSSEASSPAPVAPEPATSESSASEPPPAEADSAALQQASVEAQRRVAAADREAEAEAFAAAAKAFAAAALTAASMEAQRRVAAASREAEAEAFAIFARKLANPRSAAAQLVALLDDPMASLSECEACIAPPAPGNEPMASLSECEACMAPPGNEPAPRKELKVDPAAAAALRRSLAADGGGGGGAIAERVAALAQSLRTALFATFVGAWMKMLLKVVNRVTAWRQQQAGSSTRSSSGRKTKDAKDEFSGGSATTFAF